MTRGAYLVCGFLVSLASVAYSPTQPAAKVLPPARVTAIQCLHRFATRIGTPTVRIHLRVKWEACGCQATDVGVLVRGARVRAGGVGGAALPECQRDVVVVIEGGCAGNGGGGDGGGSIGMKEDEGEEEQILRW